MKTQAAFVLAVALAGATGAFAATAVVTISVRDVSDVNGARFVVASGVAAGAPAGDQVILEARDCVPGSAFRVIGGSETAPGGSWLIRELAVGSGATYRARWRSEISRTVSLRYALRPTSIQRRPGRRWRVHALTRWPVLTGRVAVLQRRTAAGAWLTLRRGRFVRIGSAGPGGIDYAVTFRVPRRGLTLRVFIPAATGAPCYRAGVSDEWRS